MDHVRLPSPKQPTPGAVGGDQLNVLIRARPAAAPVINEAAWVHLASTVAAQLQPLFDVAVHLRELMTDGSRESFPAGWYLA